MDLIQKELLEEIADLHGVPAGAYNIRANGAAAARNTTANIDIVSKEDKPGILLEECKRWANVREKAGKPSYLYHFARRLPGDDWGAFHSSELWYTFGTLGRCWRPMTEHDYELSEEMVTCWTNFMKIGNPNGDGQRLEENWESYTGEHPYVKLFK